jgi:hypothetical protein
MYPCACGYVAMCTWYPCVCDCVFTCTSPCARGRVSMSRRVHIVCYTRTHTWICTLTLPEQTLSAWTKFSCNDYIPGGWTTGWPQNIFPVNSSLPQFVFIIGKSLCTCGLSSRTRNYSLVSHSDGLTRSLNFPTKFWNLLNNNTPPCQQTSTNFIF